MTPTTKNPEARMSLLEHLDELRSRLFKAAIGFGLVFAACWAIAGRLVKFLVAPIRAHMFPDGEIVFRGVSFSYPLDGAEPNRTLWVMVGDPGHTLIENRVSGTGLVSTGEGVDGLGRFEEKSTTIHPSPTSFRFEMSRKYSSIGRWLEPFNIIEGRRTKETPPELPGQAAETFEKLTGLLEEDTAAAPSRVSTFILDGHAHLRVVSGASSDDPDGSPILRYSVPTGDDELLVHEWRLGETQLESLRLSLDERSPESGQAGSP